MDGGGGCGLVAGDKRLFFKRLESLLDGPVKPDHDKGEANDNWGKRSSWNMTKEKELTGVTGGLVELGHDMSSFRLSSPYMPLI